MIPSVKRAVLSTTVFALAGALLLPATACGQRPAEGRAVDTSFSALVARLSEPGGYFDTDNLLSNERSYLHALRAMRRHGVTGGAYLGVGPDQNFSYIAHVRPRVAFILDIRRDNMLQHLMFRAMFEEANTRAEWLALLFGRAKAPPATLTRAPVEAIIAWVDSTPTTPEAVAGIQRRLQARIARYGIPFDSVEEHTIERIHGEFVAAGLDIKFTTHRRGPRPYYPSYRDLLLERDLDDRPSSFMATEELFNVVRDLQRRGLVVPVVGDFAGDHALAAIGQEVRRRGLKVSAFYTSNVEQYLLRDGSFDRYAATVAKLPHDTRTVMIRSYFSGGFRPALPQTVPGYASTQLVQPMTSFVAEHAKGAYTSYADVVSLGILPP